MVRKNVATVRQLLPQRGNRLIDCARARIHDKSPDLQAEFVAGDDAAGVGPEVIEHLLFARLQHRDVVSFHESVNVCMELRGNISAPPRKAIAELKACLSSIFSELEPLRLH